MKTAFVSCVLVASVIPAIAQREPTFEALAAPACDNVLPHEPIVLYELSGSTLVAQIDRSLTVYADGSMKLSAAEAAGAGKCISAQTTPQIARALQQSLIQAGANVLCDDTTQVTDVPLHTLTILRGAHDARAHTFSYWIGDDVYANVDALLENFIVEQFPEF